MRLKAEGTQRIDRAVGRTGTVYLSVPGKNSGAGKVTVKVQNRTVEYQAVSRNEALATGTPIQVVAVVGPEHRRVDSRLPSCTGSTHVELHRLGPGTSGRQRHCVVGLRRRGRGRRVLQFRVAAGQSLQALPEQPGAGDLRQGRRRQYVPLHSRRGRLRCAADPGLTPTCSLEPMQIEVPLKGALSIENIRVNVPSVFTVAIGTEPEVMQNAAIRLLGLERRGDQAAGRGHHLRPAPPGHRLDAHRGHQPRPRKVPAQHPDFAGAGAAKRSAWC